MPKLRIEFSTDGAAFAQNGEVEVIHVLTLAAIDIANRRRSGIIRDRDGNTIGDYSLTLPESNLPETE